MKIIFKDDYKYYYIENDYLKWINFKSSNIDLSDIKHLDDAEVLYHYKDTIPGKSHPVYYECNGKIITKTSYVYTIFMISEQFYTKDYTSSNLNLL